MLRHERFLGKKDDKELSCVPTSEIRGGGRGGGGEELSEEQQDLQNVTYLFSKLVTREPENTKTTCSISGVQFHKLRVVLLC